MKLITVSIIGLSLLISNQAYATQQDLKHLFSQPFCSVDGGNTWFLIKNGYCPFNGEKSAKIKVITHSTNIVLPECSWSQWGNRITAADITGEANKNNITVNTINGTINQKDKVVLNQKYEVTQFKCVGFWNMLLWHNWKVN